MSTLHVNRFPGESDAYRAARNVLLEQEMELRRQIERLAEFRRKLPLGGELKQDYVFEEGDVDLAKENTAKQTYFSELFDPEKPSLIIYSFMYHPDDDTPCPMCTSILDSFNGTAPHVGDQANFVVVAKAPLAKIRAWARDRRWTQLRLLSSSGNSYNADYHAETPTGAQLSAINVFYRQQGKIYHTYNTELFYVPTEPNQHPRHADLFWPLWNLLDLTPQGRGSGWIPKINYD